MPVVTKHGPLRQSFKSGIGSSGPMLCRLVLVGHGGVFIGQILDHPPSVYDGEHLGSVAGNPQHTFVHCCQTKCADLAPCSPSSGHGLASLALPRILLVRRKRTRRVVTDFNVRLVCLIPPGVGREQVSRIGPTSGVPIRLNRAK